mgnify:CR=1 FL=1
MATSVADISRKKMNEVELRLYEAACHVIADAVNALMRDGLPYTKIIRPEVQ